MRADVWRIYKRLGYALEIAEAVAHGYPQGRRLAALKAFSPWRLTVESDTNRYAV
jgi:hypothetical protein